MERGRTQVSYDPASGLNHKPEMSGGQLDLFFERHGTRRLLLLCLISLALVFVTSKSTARSSGRAAEERTSDVAVPTLGTEQLFSSNGLTTEVQWDSFSLIVKGQRIFLQYVVLLYDSISAIKMFETALANSIHTACLLFLSG